MTGWKIAISIAQVCVDGDFVQAGNESERGGHPATLAFLLVLRKCEAVYYASRAALIIRAPQTYTTYSSSAKFFLSKLG